MFAYQMETDIFDIVASVLQGRGYINPISVHNRRQI